MKKIKIAIVGCGRIFDKHNVAINNLKKKFEIESVCDLDPKKLKKNIISKKIQIYESLDKMCANTSSDLVVILTPSGFHFDQIIKLSNHFKNIIVEKPMVMNFMQANIISRYCKKNKINLFIVKQNRFNPAIIKLKEAIDQKRFGKIFLATVRVRWSRNNKYFLQDNWRGTWKNDGGVLANQASHHIDLIQWLIGDVQSVFAKSLKIVKKTNADDTCLAILKFKNGAIGSIEATTATSPRDLEGSISVLGEKGTVVVGGYAVSKIDTWQFDIMKKKDKDIYKFSHNNKNVYGSGHIEFYKNIYKFLTKKKNNAITYKDGIKSIKIIDKIYASSETSKEIFMKDDIFSKKLGF